MSDADNRRSPQERELAARSAVLVARLFEVQGWRYSGSSGEHVAGVEEIAETIEWLMGELDAENKDASTGRLLVLRTDIGIETYLRLGILHDDGTVDVDDTPPASHKDGDGAVDG